MKIELKKFQFFERMSEETNAFVADVYVNGKKVAYAKNDGHGGDTYYHPYATDNALLRKAEEYCLSLPPIKYPAEHGMEAFEIKMNLTHFIDDLVTAEIKKKDQKKMEKKMEKAIMWGVPNGYRYTQVAFKVPLAQIPRPQLQMYVNKYKSQFKEGEQFLNTNLESLGIKI